MYMITAIFCLLKSINHFLNNCKSPQARMSLIFCSIVNMLKLYHCESDLKRKSQFIFFFQMAVINAENAAHKSEKFSAMARRTRHEYLKDLATNFVTNTTLETGAKGKGMRRPSS